MNIANQEKWDRAAVAYDFMSGIGPERRWAPEKLKLFSNMDGKVLFLALGTGLDIEFFPPNREIAAIDISPKMLEGAQARIDAYSGTIEAQVMDVHDMSFADHTFDQIYTSCTFCSVPDPIDGLKSLQRVLKPGGHLRMFEHTGSRFLPFKLMMDFMTPLSRRVGPEMNRNTVANVEAAGFEILQVRHIYLDVVKTISAVAPSAKIDDVSQAPTV